ncbi:MAG: XdhC family protein [Gammaproteobacteria bacterium]
MNSRHIVDRFALGREQGEDMVLVTVYDTLGSTYSKAGARMLITAGGHSQGLVSGGCLEGDLAERARRVLSDRTSMDVTYDLRDEADELFGLGIGCNGLIRVLLQPLNADNGYEPMTSIAHALLGDDVAAIATVVLSNRSDVGAGASLLVDTEGAHRLGLPADYGATFAAGCKAAIEARVSHLADELEGLTVLYAPLVPVPKLLLLGAGLDAVPLVNVAAELGWRVWVADHRPGYLERAGLDRAEQKRVVVPRSLAEDLPLARFDAIVVMSHHLDTDREYLRQLAGIHAPYVGLLGPPARRQRLLDELGDAGHELEAHLHGPVGIDIGADSAESIALSIAAEIQSVLSRVGAPQRPVDG